MYVILLILLVVVAAAVLLRWRVVAQAEAQRRLHARMQGVRCGAPDEIGLSVLLTEEAAPQQIESLLTVEYACYEVIVVVDGAIEAATFVELVRRFQLIRVEYRPTGELPSVAVRGLYRSRRRRFRRLVVLDTAAERRVERMNAAADVAAYDYLLPIRRGERLVAGAVERLVCLIGGHAEGVRLVRVTEGVRCYLCARSAVVEAGGFGRFPMRRRGLRLHERILCRMEGRRGVWMWCLRGLFLVVCLWLVRSIEQGWVRVAVAVTGALVVLVSLRIGQLTRSE